MNAPRTSADAVSPSTLGELQQLRQDFTRFVMQYKFGIDEMVTKASILREEFIQMHDYNPIEHVTSRLKTPESIIEKVERKNCEPSFEAIRESITDIAGVRITCSFISDTYRVFDLLTSQDDVRVVHVKDYIAQPKANGYKSLHALVEIPVFLSDGAVPVLIELQMRTVAMDFWASLEHKIYYKYQRQIPQALIDDLKEAADTANRLDANMERLHAEVQNLRAVPAVKENAPGDQQDLPPDEKQLLQLQKFRERFKVHQTKGN